MILSPFVFLQLTPTEPRTDPVSKTTLHWTPIPSLIAPNAWSHVSVDAASRLAPKNSTALRLLVRSLVGSMQFPAIILDDCSAPQAPPQPRLTHDILEKGVHLIPPPPPTHNLKLWGLSLGMVLDLLSFMGSAPSTSPRMSSSGLSRERSSPTLQLPFQGAGESMGLDVVAPSLASVFPRFSYPDVNFWIW
jgi:hypothetical protein